jgi:chaperonin GroEL (HSP60 family)
MYEETVKEVNEAYLAAKDKANKVIGTTLTKDYMDIHQRYVKLLGKIGVINIGAPSDLEKWYLKDPIDDAVLACRSAYDNGYIRGMNFAILKHITDLVSTVYDDIPGYTPAPRSLRLKEILLDVLFESFAAIPLAVMKNKYQYDISRDVKFITTAEGDLAEYSLPLTSEEIIEIAVKDGYSYDLITETCVQDIAKATNINSISTDIEILRAIVSILSTVLTSNQYITTQLFTRAELS